MELPTAAHKSVSTMLCQGMAFFRQVPRFRCLALVCVRAGVCVCVGVFPALYCALKVGVWQHQAQVRGEEDDILPYE